MRRQNALAEVGPILIVGAGLLGTSLGLGLRNLGVEVYLEDPSPAAVALAQDMGAGVPMTENLAAPKIVFVAAPPDVCGAVVGECLQRHPEATVSDVASVKAQIYQSVVSAGADVSRYVGSHPMAGRERSGGAFARADLFTGNPWVITGMESADSDRVLAVKTIAVALGALPIEMEATQHDAAVATVSHVPQLISSTLAARLTEIDVSALSLAGQGLRDSTRIAASDPRLWAAIIGANAVPIGAVLKEFSRELDELIAALDFAGTQSNSPALIGAVTKLMREGNLGVARIPGKHGGAPRRYAEVMVVVPDEAGALGRLFNQVGQVNVNIEDLALEHSPRAAAGIARLFVEPAAAQPLVEALQARGWQISEF